MVGVTTGELLYESHFLIVRAASLPQLLAMKLAAWRDAVDREDARLLLLRMSGSVDDVWQTVKPFVLSTRSTRRGTRFKICGRHFMDLRDLVRAILSGDLLAAANGLPMLNAPTCGGEVGKPSGLDEREMTVAAGVAELSHESGGAAPPWTASIGSSDEPLFLDPGLQDMRGRWRMRSLKVGAVPPAQPDCVS